MKKAHESAGLIAVGVGIGVLATLMLRPLPEAEPGSRDQSNPNPQTVNGEQVEARVSTTIAPAPDSPRDAELQPAAPVIVDQANEPAAQQREPEIVYAQPAFPSPPNTFPYPDRLIGDLVAGGFTEARATAIKAKFDDLMNESFAYSNSIEAYESSLLGRLRREMEDREFEQYLKATNYVADVEVVYLNDESPASLAGLQPWDRIVSYDGNRVFDSREINAMSQAGEPGEGVVVEFIRDGQLMQLVIPREPLDAVLYSGSHSRFIAPPK